MAAFADRRLAVVPSGWRDAPVMLAPLSGRYLSFAEREEIATCARKGWGCARSPAGGPVPVDDLARAAPQRVNPQSRGCVPGDDGTVAC